MKNHSGQEATLVRSMRTGPYGYFAFAILWSALFWIASWRMGGGADPSASPLFLIGGAGPLIGALVLIHFRESRVLQWDFWARIADPRRMGLKWFTVAVFIHPLIVLCAITLDLALGGTLPSFEKWPATASALFSTVFFVFWFGPLPEEIGWRGFAQDRLQRSLNPLKASLLLGFVWSLWHLPLFFIPGTFQADIIGAWTPRFWIFMMANIPLTVVITWVYNHTHRSTLAAAIIHYTGNLVGNFYPKTDRLAAFEVLFLIVAAVIVARNFPRQPLYEAAGTPRSRKPNFPV